MANISKLKLNNITYDIKDALARQALDELGTALVFKGTIGSETQGSGTISSIPTSNVSVGDTWLIVDEARTLSAEYSATGEAVLLDIGDSIIATSEDPLYATAAGTDTQGVTSVATGTGLTGGPITTSGTISVDFNSVQSKLVSGTDIKTINNTSLLGSGDITVGGDTNVIETVKVNNTALPVSNKAVNIDLSGYATTSALSNKQDTLVSGTNIKTINSTSLLGSGNIDVQGVLTAGENITIDANNEISVNMTPITNQYIDSLFS